MSQEFIDQYKTAIMGVREAVEQALVTPPPVEECECGRRFCFLGETGFEHRPGGHCPRCATPDDGTDGIALEVEQVNRLLADRRVLLSIADEIAAEGADRAETIAYLEQMEQRSGFLQWLSMAKQCTSDRMAAYRTALLVQDQGLPVAATQDPIAASIARRVAVLRPEAVVRVVLKVGGRVHYDGDLTAKAGRMIRELEQKHGRKLRVTCHQRDGKTVVRRGERDDPEVPKASEPLGGVRAMMAEGITRKSDKPMEIQSKPFTVDTIREAWRIIEENKVQPIACPGCGKPHYLLQDGEIVGDSTITKPWLCMSCTEAVV